MRLHSVRIENFRAFADETIFFDDYTCLVGPNGGGKSTILTALNVFFRETANARTDLEKLGKQDFHHGNTQSPIKITVTFDNLSQEAKEDLKDYVRQSKLIVAASASWNDDDGFAQVLQYGERLGMEAFKPFFSAEGDGVSVADLKRLYAGIREAHEELPAPGTKAVMIASLRNYESENPDRCVLIPSQDQFYGFSKGSNRISKYIQWVFVPGVKDASEEQIEGANTLLGQLLARTVRTRVSFKDSLKTLREETDGRYQSILDGQQNQLEELSRSLTKRLAEWARPGTSLDLQWINEAGKSIKIAEPLAQFIVGEGNFKGQLARVGHGCQRSFIIALLEELAGSGQAAGPRLLLGCEEPELYQHPPQARHLAAVMERLSTNNSQIILCTHSPYFVSGKQVESVRSIRSSLATKCSRCRRVNLTEISGEIDTARGERPVGPTGRMLKVHQALQLAINEMFFTDVLILVEGLEDLAYITAYITLNDQWDRFRRAGCHIVAAGGKSEIAQPLVIAKKLEIPTFVVFDSDSHSVPQPGQPDERGRRAMHEKDNVALLKLCGVTTPEPFPAATLWRDNLVMWKSEIGDVIKGDLQPGDWENFGNAVRSQYQIDVGDINKNSLFIGYRLTAAWDAGKKSQTLTNLCDSILSFAEANHTAQAGNAGGGP